MEIIKSNYEFLCNKPSDINQHLPTLFKYASQCESVVECGVRGCVSSWAFIHGLMNNNKPTKEILLNDIQPCDIRGVLYLSQQVETKIEVKYEWVNDLDLILDHPYDLLFIDTWHVYGQLKRELNKFSPFINKYIIMHDTTVDEIEGETVRNKWNSLHQSATTGIPEEEINDGLGRAIHEFLSSNPEWTLLEKWTNNNGLTVLERVRLTNPVDGDNISETENSSQSR